MEGRRVFEDLTVEENLVAATYALTGRKRRQARFRHCLQYFPRLHERRKSLAGYLSGGEQQMLAIGRALIAQPELILLDEPSLGLSPKLVEDIFGIIARINAERGTSMLLVEQNATVALAVAHSGYIMENGKIVIDGTAERLASDPDVREFYLGMGGGGEPRASRTSSTTSAAKGGCHDSIPLSCAPLPLLSPRCRQGGRCANAPLPPNSPCRRCCANAQRAMRAAGHPAKGLRHLEALHLGAVPPRACHFGLGLRALGLPTGGHVGVMSENRIEWVLAQMGAGLVGAVTVGVYPTSPSSEVAYVVGHADIEIMVCEDQEQTDKLLEALDQLPRLKKIVVMETKGLRSFAPEVRA
jgi:hypothetical protein